MMTRSRMRHVVPTALLLSLALLATGCASLAMSTETMAQRQSYDLPKDVDAAVVIHAVERSFAEVLSTAPRTVEGAMPSPLPIRPHHVAMRARRIPLDRLGNVLIPSVACPQHLALISAWPAFLDTRRTVHQYTACIQPYAEGYRVTLIAHASRLGDPIQEELKDGWEATSIKEIGRIGEYLQAQISVARSIAASHGKQALSPVTEEKAFLGRDEGTVLPERRAAMLQPQLSSTSLPLVCLAPKGRTAILQSQPGGGRRVGTVEEGSVLAVADPLDTSYFKVETERGSTGWVNRSEVIRLSCPVG